MCGLGGDVVEGLGVLQVLQVGVLVMPLYWQQCIELSSTN